uniref:NADH-ubiquinone oxidoreductase chain 4 n=1 Tax=Turritopsis dohrnii TaxID=308579 RepID=A0A1B0TFW5_9CNID|nr:NADH dehydrogenase subunit 4 [Turritopsis dohrnii]ALK27159.1 NADH dehydrogenase subunit 4 [Turritopsis dohrnii]
MFLKMILILPILAIFHLLFINKNNKRSLETISLFWSFIIFINFIVLVIVYNEKSQFQYSLWLDWFNSSTFGLNWGLVALSIDGISIWFLGLTIILIPICLIMSWKAINYLKKEFIIALFSIMLLLIYVFLVLDLLMFYIFFEAILIPMFIIIGIWGSREEKVKAAFYFFFYTLVGSLLMLISIFKIYSMFGTTNYQNLCTLEIPLQLQYWLFLGFLASLATKIPMIPVHIWLPQAHVEAPLAGSVILAGILLKLGGYGMIRFSFILFPIASEYFSPLIILFSILALIYASLTTCRQTDLKRLIAYSSVAHMGLVTLSIFTHSIEGLIASVTMMLAHGLVSSALFMSSAILYVRFHSRLIKYFKGITLTMPLFSSLTLIFIIANMGFPLTFNFIAEFLSLLTAFKYSKFVAISICLGLLLSTVYSLYLYNRVFFGTISSHLLYSRDLLSFEFQGFLPLLVLTILLGILPNLVFKSTLYSSYINISL